MSAPERTHPGSFDLLSPDAISAAVEGSLGLGVDGTISAYPSYVNRVYGLRLDDGRDVVAKFYRPGRWSRDCILDEHRFIADAASAELPVALPIALEGGDTLGQLLLEDELGETSFYFALFPKMGGRNFDAEADDDWLRLGALLGRLHLVGGRRPAPARLVCGPESLTSPQIDYLLGQGVVHGDVAPELEALCRGVIGQLAPLFRGLDLRRIHGDCHRGNILDRLGSGSAGGGPGEGLYVIDFDDMMTGPAVQDLWLLLPDHADKCRRELGLLVEGYETFLPFDRRELELIEGLRFMRMVYFLAWRAAQRHDKWFRSSFPDWGSKDFWITELGDLRDQAELALGEAPALPERGDADEGGEEDFAAWEKD
jgi:Ser/Thr protein kinase RdoA (MazF antagonist)